MASTVISLTPIINEFKKRERLATNIKRDLHLLLVATASSVVKRPVYWSDVRALLPIPVDKSLAMALLAEETVVHDWNH
jgi:hypothetical protein